MPGNVTVHQNKFVGVVRRGLFAVLLSSYFGAAPAEPVSVFSEPQRVPSARAASEKVRPFVAGSLAKIVAERQGRPVVVTFWSATCVYCPQELKTLGEIRKAHPKLDVVIVAADTLEEAPLAAELATRYGLGKAEQWIFAGETEERLRFEIDPRWHGELPRTYFYDREHRMEAVSGIVPRQQLLAWVKANVR